jgi:hypothetical protein
MCGDLGVVESALPGFAEATVSFLRELVQFALLLLQHLGN